MVRSRAFVAILGSYSSQELRYLRSWVNDRCTNWIIEHYILDGLPALKLYMRFQNPICISTLSKVNERFDIQCTTLSFRNAVGIYRDSKNKVEISSSNQEDNMNKFEKNLLQVLDNKVKLGMITWIHYDKNTNEYLKFISFLKHIRNKNEIIITNKGGVSTIKPSLLQAINQNIKAKAIILMPHANKIEDDYYEVIDQLRTGVIINSQICETPCFTNPLNVLVFADASPDSEIKASLNIQLMTI